MRRKGYPLSTRLKCLCAQLDFYTCHVSSLKQRTGRHFATLRYIILILIQTPMNYMTVDINNLISYYLRQLVINLRCIRDNCSLTLKSHIFTLLHGAGNCNGSGKET